ncbi:MAG: DNA-processing protein DprA [bacterium]|nr:DNA-processing protein DprA [bacterium]
MLTLSNDLLPAELTRLAQPPKQVYCSSENFDSFLAMPRLAIIGSRKISPYGRNVTTKFASELAQRGVAIISGLALGTDSVAHTAALDAGGITIAVLPSGLDRIYPTSHNQLARRIVENSGALITEYPFKTEPRKENFVARNRIIAALAEGILIPEAALKSGSLHTARFALELGLPVLAVPGPITSPTSEGTNNLIKAGAVPVTSVEDIIHALNWRLDAQISLELQANTEPERVILELIHSGTTDGSELLIASKLSASEFNQSVTMLELSSRIRPLGNNHWSLT